MSKLKKQDDIKKIANELAKLRVKLAHVDNKIPLENSSTLMKSFIFKEYVLREYPPYTAWKVKQNYHVFIPVDPVSFHTFMLSKEENEPFLIISDGLQYSYGGTTYNIRSFGYISLIYDPLGGDQTIPIVAPSLLWISDSLGSYFAPPALYYFGEESYTFDQFSGLTKWYPISPVESVFFAISSFGWGSFDDLASYYPFESTEELTYPIWCVPRILDACAERLNYLTPLLYGSTQYLQEISTKPDYSFYLNRIKHIDIRNRLTLLKNDILLLEQVGNNPGGSFTNLTDLLENTGYGSSWIDYKRVQQGNALSQLYSVLGQLSYAKLNILKPEPCAISNFQIEYYYYCSSTPGLQYASSNWNIPSAPNFSRPIGKESQYVPVAWYHHDSPGSLAWMRLAYIVITAPSYCNVDEFDSTNLAFRYCKMNEAVYHKDSVFDPNPTEFTVTIKISNEYANPYIDEYGVQHKEFVSWIWSNNSQGEFNATIRETYGIFGRPDIFPEPENKVTLNVDIYNFPEVCLGTGCWAQTGMLEFVVKGEL